MVVKINGQPISLLEVEQPKEIAHPSERLQKFVLFMWTTLGGLIAESRRAQAAGMTDTAQPLIYDFQDIVLTFGSLAIIVGIILLAVKKKWGIKTLQLTGGISMAVFLAPAALLIMAIIGISINDHLMNTLDAMRKAHQH